MSSISGLHLRDKVKGGVGKVGGGDSKVVCYAPNNGTKLSPMIKGRLDGQRERQLIS
jgi:hypothetical protein